MIMMNIMIIMIYEIIDVGGDIVDDDVMMKINMVVIMYCISYSDL
jgi:hypothetical protein